MFRKQFFLRGDTHRVSRLANVFHRRHGQCYGGRAQDQPVRGISQRRGIRPVRAGLVLLIWEWKSNNKAESQACGQGPPHTGSTTVVRALHGECKNNNKAESQACGQRPPHTGSTTVARVLHGKWKSNNKAESQACGQWQPYLAQQFSK